MSEPGNGEQVASEATVYEHFSSVFYDIWGDDPDVMRQAQDINDEYNRALRENGVSSPYQLPVAVQQELNQRKVMINFTED